MLKITEEELRKILPQDGPAISEVKKYLDKYNNEYIVIKCGGSVLINKKLFDNFIENISILKKLGFNPIVIHGGGKRISEKLNENGIQSNFVNGIRVTDKRSITIVEEVLNSFNKEIIDALEKNSCASQGVSNRERNIITVVKENKKLGFVGIPEEIDHNIIEKIIEEKKVPVIAPLGLDNENCVHNINADTVASAIAKKLNARRLIIMSDVEGVLDANKNLIFEINTQTVEELIAKKIISGGMIPKIQNCLDVANNGVKGVVIIDGRKSHSILFELLSDEGSGTLIRKK